MRNATRIALAMALSGATLGAQDVTVRSSSNVRFLGGFGKLMSLAARFGGKNVNEPTATTVYLSGHKMRTDNGDNASIVDVDAGRIISSDNKEKTYFSMTFEEMAEMARRVGDSLKVARARGAKGDVETKYQVSVDRTGEKAKIAGYDAERVFMTITMTADVTPEGEKTQEAGSTVFLIDEWISKDAAHAAAMKEFQRAYMQKLGGEMQEAAKGLEAAFTTNPQLKEGFAAAAKERQKVQGISLRSTTLVAFVPAGSTFDRQLALNDAASAPAAEEGGKKGGGLRGMMGGLKKMAEEGNAKGEKTAAPPKQGTMMIVKAETNSIEKGSVDGSLFAPPAGYKEVKMRGMQ